MKKLIILSKSTNKNILSSFLGTFFTSEYSEVNSGAEAEEIILGHNPDFILFNNFKPVNGMDMMSVLRHIDGNIRLRVAIFNLGEFKKRERRILSPANSR